MVSFSRWLALNTKLLNFDCQSPSLGCAVLYYSWARKINISFRKKPSSEQCEWEWKRADRFLSPPHSPDAGRVKSFHFLVAEKGIKCWNHTVSDQCVVRRVGLVASDPCKAVACLPTAHFGRWYSVAVLFEVFHRVDIYMCVCLKPWDCRWKRLVISQSGRPSCYSQPLHRYRSGEMKHRNSFECSC